MPNSAEQNIYDRLAAAPTFHPITADLFVDDWGLDAGDVVTVRSGETDYSVPIYSMSLDWRGSTKAQIHSTGNQTRKPLSALKRKQYYGRSSSRKYTDEQGVRIESDIRDIGNGLAVIVEKKDGKYTIKRASIVAAINEDDTSTVTIDADNINLTGYVTASYIDAEKAVVDKLITSEGYAGTIYASSFSGTSGNITSMTVGNLYMTTSGQASDQITRKAVKIGGTTSSTLTVLGTGSAVALEVPDAITALQIVPPEQGSNTYTLQGKSFNSPSQWSDIGTFSRATSLSGAWSGSTFTVTATPQGETESTTIAASGDGWDYDANLSRYYNTVRVKNDGGNVTRASVDILLPTITLSAGNFNAQHKATVHAYGPSYEGSTYSVATALEVNASGVYTEGYTDGKDENEGISVLGLSSAYDTQPSADEYKGELTANKYYKVTAVPVSGTGKSFSFKTPAGGSDSSLVTYISNCQGSDASSYVQYSGASSVNSNVVKDADGVKGYVWMKGPNGWERTRYIPISHPQTTAGISYISHDRGTYSGYLRVTVHMTGGSTETYTSQPM